MVSLLLFSNSACFSGYYGISDDVVSNHEMDMCPLQLDDQKRFLRSCKILQVQEGMMAKKKARCRVSAAGRGLLLFMEEKAAALDHILHALRGVHIGLKYRLAGWIYVSAPGSPNFIQRKRLRAFWYGFRGGLII